VLVAAQRGDQGEPLENRAVELLMEGLADATAEEGKGLENPDFSSLSKRTEFMKLRKRFEGRPQVD
jgi:hypothetical protein